MNIQSQTYDAVARVLANAVKTPQELELDRQRFRSRARIDARNVLRNYRSVDGFFMNVESVLFSLCGQDAGLIIKSVDVAIAHLERGMRINTSHIGTIFYSGNKHMALRSRLVQARYFRRFGFPS